MYLGSLSSSAEDFSHAKPAPVHRSLPLRNLSMESLKNGESGLAECESEGSTTWKTKSWREEMLRTPKARGVISLTKREQQVLKHIWDGLRNRDIGTQLKISPKTVEAHRANMMKKLRVTNAAQLLKQCLEQGFLPQPRSAA